MSLLLSMMLAASPVYGAKPEALAVEALHNFGACVARTAPAGAEEVLAMDYRTDAYRQKLSRLAKGHDRCVSPRSQLRFNGVLFAGALAEALVEQPGRSVLTRLSAAEDANAPVEARSALEAMALCGVMTRPAAAGRLLESEVGSEMEADAMEALLPTMTGCLTEASKAELNKPALRSIVALAAWRIVSTAESKSQAEGAQ